MCNPKGVFKKSHLTNSMEKNCLNIKYMGQGFPGGTVVENPPAIAGDTGFSPGPGRSHMLRSN